MVSRYELSEIKKERVTSVQVQNLIDREADLSVTISPSEGGQVTEMIFKGEKILRSSDGVPILFPWPNRIANARFDFKGRTVKLIPNMKGGYAIHGLVEKKNWKVEEKGISGNGVHLVESLQSRDFLDITDLFPYQFKIMIDWVVKEGTLEFTTTAINEGDTTMPMGFGVHANFRVPIRDGSSRENCLLTIPADGYWEKEDPDAVGSGKILPTGRILRVDGTKFDLRKPKLVRDFLLDDVLTDLKMENGWTTCKIYDPEADITILTLSDENFPNICVFLSSDRYVSVEPYTCTTDAFNLESRNIKAGMIALEPGETWTGTIKIIPKTGRLI